MLLRHNFSFISHLPAALRPAAPAPGASGAAPAEAPPCASAPATLVALLQDSFERWPQRVALRFAGRAFTYARLDAWSGALAMWLQASALAPGDRVAVLLPNLPQFPVAAAAVLRAGMVLVNIAPDSTSADLDHVLRDSGAKAVIAIDTALPALQPIWRRLNIAHLLVTAPGDLLGPVRGRWLNRRRSAGAEASPQLPGATRWHAALALGRRLPQQALEAVHVGPDDIALLHYTGGHMAQPLGAVLLHRQLAASVWQCHQWLEPALLRLPSQQALHMGWLLPLHHLHGFSLSMMLTLHLGGCGLLVHDALDPASTLRSLAQQPLHGLVGADDVFRALAHHASAGTADWSGMLLTVASGQPVQHATAQRWQQLTGCVLQEAYGPAACNPLVSLAPAGDTGQGGAVCNHHTRLAMAFPDTDLRLLDTDSRAMATGAGMPGEIAVRGPQVMAGYWQRPEETARVMTADGYLRTGEPGVLDSAGRIRWVLRSHSGAVADESTDKQTYKQAATAAAATQPAPRSAREAST